MQSYGKTGVKSSTAVLQNKLELCTKSLFFLRSFGVIFSPSHTTFPLSGEIRPDIILTRVVFPEPLSPTSEQNSFLSRKKLTLSAAVNFLPSVTKHLVMLFADKIYLTSYQQSGIEQLLCIFVFRG